MTTIELIFRAGRYHATPWGRHVNEGVAEWPPSPYRLLRALFDVWQRKCADLPQSAIVEVFQTLGEECPRFHLPKAVSSHTRAYLSSNTLDTSDKSLIFDSFVAVSPETPCLVEWSAELSAPQAQTLARLLAGLNYLGRSESWIEARLVTCGIPEINCEPASSDNPPGEMEIVSVASPVAPSAYSAKRSWFDALTYSTTELVKERRSAPPAMRHVPYARRKDAVTTWLRPSQPRRNLKISLVELSLHSKVLPLATETLRVAELVRAALMKKAGEKSRLLSGKNGEGVPLKGHRHSFYLPQFDDLDRINRVMLILNHEDFDPHDIEAILALKSLRRFGDEPMRVALTRAGSAKQRDSATRVVSSTPFIPVRHWREGRGEWHDFVDSEVRLECDHHGLPQPVHIEPSRLKSPRFEPVHFRRSRKDDAPRRGMGMSIEFPTAVRVPFSIGYGCHFGLGQFVSL